MRHDRPHGLAKLSPRCADRSLTAAAHGGRRSVGFTLLEVLVVVIIIGIAGAMVVPQLLAAGSLSIQGAARLVVSDLVYAQNEAVAMHRTHQVVFEPTDDRYALMDENDALLQSAWVGGDYIIDFANDSRFRGIRIDAVDFNGETTLTFDELGSPSQGGYIDIADQHQSYRIRVAPFTGRVTVAPKP